MQIMSVSAWEQHAAWDASAESYAQGAGTSGGSLFQPSVDLMTDWLKFETKGRPFVLLDVASGPGE